MGYSSPLPVRVDIAVSYPVDPCIERSAPPSQFALEAVQNYSDESLVVVEVVIGASVVSEVGLPTSPVVLCVGWSGA